MSIEFHCDGCGRLLRVPDASSGSEAMCSMCGRVATVPLLDAAVIDDLDVVLEAEVLDSSSGQMPSPLYVSQADADNPFRQHGLGNAVSTPHELAQKSSTGLWMLLIGGAAILFMATAVVLPIFMLARRATQANVRDPVVARQLPAENTWTAPIAPRMPTPTPRPFPESSMRSIPMPEFPEMPEMAVPPMPEFPGAAAHDLSGSKPARPLSPPPVSTLGMGGYPQGRIEFTVRSYEGPKGGLARARAMGVLGRYPWIDLSRLSVDLDAGEIVVGVRHSPVDIESAKEGLERVGFTLGETRIVDVLTPAGAANSRPVPGTGRPPGVGQPSMSPFADHGQVVFEVESYQPQRRLPAHIQVRISLLRLRWVDPNRITVNANQTEIVVGVRRAPVDIDANAATALLEKAGFKIVSAQFHPNGIPREESD